MEVHSELLTRSKMFCSCPVEFGGEPNTRVCPVCLALPGSLPVPNKLAIELVLKTALALNCTIAMDSIFHRKNYFYPDIPKGYQISQYGDTNPLGYDGYLDIPAKDGGTKRIKIRRVHLEEDTGKLTHLPTGDSGVDYNRAGVPLMEIVTEFPPDIESPEDAKEYLVQLRAILVWIGVCDGKMEEGSLRCEPNISVREEGSEKFGTKTELKNLNSFRSVQLGVEFETRRQVALLEHGGTVKQETRGWNENSETSYLMRDKESENDYRYFPDPDLVPMAFTEEYIQSLRESLPELPLVTLGRYRDTLGLQPKHAAQLASDREWSGFFDECIALGGEPQAICNWLIADFSAKLNDSGQTPRQSKISPKILVELVELVKSNTINGKIAKQVFSESFQSGEMPGEIVKSKGLSQIADSGLVRETCERIINTRPDLIEKFKAGQASVKGFFVGEVMKEGKGRLSPQMVQEMVQEVLENA